MITLLLALAALSTLVAVAIRGVWRKGFGGAAAPMIIALSTVYFLLVFMIFEFFSPVLA